MEEDFAMLQERRADVRNRYQNVTFPNPVLNSLWVGKRNLTRLTDQRALVDQNNENRLMAIVSDRYKIIPYEDTITMVEEVTKEVTGYGAIQLCPQVFANGGKFKLTMKFPESVHVIREGDGIVPKIDVFNSLDLGMKLLGRYGAFRLRCTNGMGVWEHFKKFARRHLQTLFLEDLKVSILEGMATFGMQVEGWKRWTEIEMTENAYNGAWEMLPFSEAEKEKVEALRGIGDQLTLTDALKQKVLTLWDMNNVLTQFSSHEVKSEIRRIELEPRIAQSMEKLYLQLAA